MKLWQFPKVKKEDFPEGYKLSWIVFNLTTEKERILFDNHWGKPLHYHENGKEQFLKWISLEHTEKLFYQMVIRNLAILTMSKTNKTFIFQYDPHFSPKRMFSEFKEAINGKKYIQAENVLVANDLATIYQIISKDRLEVFASIKEYQPKSIHELSHLLKRDYINVQDDCQILANCGIIKLEKLEQEYKPSVLYEQIVLDFPSSKFSDKKKELDENFKI